MAVFPTNVPGCINKVSTEDGSIKEMDNGAVLVTLHQACDGDVAVAVSYLLTDGIFCKDVKITVDAGATVFKQRLYRQADEKPLTAKLSLPVSRLSLD